MFRLEKASNLLADKLSKELMFEDEKKEVIAYGAFALLQTILSIILVGLIGWAFKVASEALIISFTVSILRKYSGGVHASTSDSCTIIGTTVFVGLAKVLLLLKNLISIQLVVIIMIVSLLWSYYIVFKLAPVESQSKKLSENKKIRMKRGSITVISVYAFITFVLVILSYAKQQQGLLMISLCICIGSAWQMFTLTQTGHLWLGKIDKILSYIL